MHPRKSFSKDLCELCKNKYKQKGYIYAFTLYFEANACCFLSSLKAHPCCQDFTTALAGLLMCYLVTSELDSVLVITVTRQACRIFFFFFNSGCIFFPKSSISCWVEKAQFHPGFPTVQCESVSQDTVTPAAVGGICFCNLSSEQKNFLDLYAYNCNFHCKWKFILAAKGR